MKHQLLTVLLLGASCGDSIVSPDLPDEIPLTLTTLHPPSLVAYRNAAETEWKQADMVGPTTFQFYVRGPSVIG